ncbi:MAG: hypothetical protein GY775_10170, partial [Candidatus Scalindua sp.]|nr:hypothetical protein [Candidatus Scalindua sp.]
TTSMLPVSDLRAALDEGITHYHLTALYKLADLRDYYRIIESSLGKNYFLIHIPMSSDVEYNAYHLIPFPLRLDSRTVQLASGDRIFLINDELTTVDVLNIEVLEQCKKDVKSDYICPAFPFHFHQAVDHECEIALVKNNTQKALDQCTYSDFKEEYFQRHFYGFNYFYFQDLTSVTVVCVDDPTMVEVIGYYKAPDYCRILTRFVMTSPSRHHLALIKNISIDIPVFEAMFNVAFPHIELPVANISLISVYMNDSDLAEAIADNLPFMTDHAFYWPVLSTQYIVTIVCAIVMGCLFHKLMVKYDVVSHRLDPH